jgi:general secretion pathway protein C
MLARLSAFVIWALVAATAVFWGLRLFVRPSTAPAYAVTVGEAGAVRGDLSRVLGATPANVPTQFAPATSSRFKLLGIVAPRAAQASEVVEPGRAPHGVALIAIDGKMPKAYAVGARVDGDLVLQSVSLRTVSIAGEGAPAITLELPALSAPATGTLPGAMAGSGPALPMGRPMSVPQFIPQPDSPAAVQIQPQYAPSTQPAPLPAPPGQGFIPPPGNAPNQ